MQKWKYYVENGHGCLENEGGDSPMELESYFYAAPEVDSLLQANAVTASQIVTDLNAHVAQLELALNQIINSCVDDGDEALAHWKLSPAEIRKLARTALGLMEGSSHG